MTLQYQLLTLLGSLWARIHYQTRLWPVCVRVRVDRVRVVRACGPCVWPVCVFREGVYPLWTPICIQQYTMRWKN